MQLNLHAAIPGGGLDKKKFSEADICDKFITPAIQQSGWDTIEQIYREYTLRPGRVVVRGHTASRIHLFKQYDSLDKPVMPTISSTPPAP